MERIVHVFLSICADAREIALSATPVRGNAAHGSCLLGRGETHQNVHSAAVTASAPCNWLIKYRWPSSDQWKGRMLHRIFDSMLTLPVRMVLYFDSFQQIYSSSESCEIVTPRPIIGKLPKNDRTYSFCWYELFSSNWRHEVGAFMNLLWRLDERKPLPFWRSNYSMIHLFYILDYITEFQQSVVLCRIFEYR